MSDNVCGGGASNLLKALADQVDRDRSIHQAQPAGSAASANNVFRTARAGGNAEQDFNAFTQGTAAMNAMNAMGGGGGGGVFVTDPIQPNVVGTIVTGSQGAAWVNQFHQMNIGGGGINALPAVPGAPGAIAVVAPPAAHVLAVNHGIMSNMGMPVMPGVLAGPPAAAALHVDPVDPLGGLTQEELDAKFAEFEAEYEARVAENADFENHMATWMAEHGPPAAENEPATTMTTQEAEQNTAAPAEAEATATEEKPTTGDDQDEVAKAAAQIAAVMGNDASEKFQNSRFLNLMRRAGNKEVVIEGDNFVDKDTHETVATIQYPDGKENQEEKPADH